MADVCGDNRLEIIEQAKKDLLESTNIESSSDEMKVLDSFLFRCWQMGWLKEKKTQQEKTIDWEERWYDLAKELYLRYPSFKEDDAVKLANKFIKVAKNVEH